MYQFVRDLTPGKARLASTSPREALDKVDANSRTPFTLIQQKDLFGLTTTTKEPQRAAPEKL